MPICKLFRNGTEINRIVFNDIKWLTSFCKEKQCTYEIEPDPRSQLNPIEDLQNEDAIETLLNAVIHT